MTKQLVQEALQKEADEFDLDAFVEKLLLIDAVEQAKKEYKEGNYVSQAEIEAQFANKWVL